MTNDAAYIELCDGLARVKKILVNDGYYDLHCENSIKRALISYIHAENDLLHLWEKVSSRLDEYSDHDYQLGDLVTLMQLYFSLIGDEEKLYDLMTIYLPSIDRSNLIGFFDTNVLLFFYMISRYVAKGRLDRSWTLYHVLCSFKNPIGDTFDRSITDKQGLADLWEEELFLNVPK